MKITKFGHCCLLLEERGVKILIDPGMYSTGQNYVLEVSAILITHVHTDHLDLSSLKVILQNNPNAKIITTKSVKALLAKERINSIVLVNGGRMEVKGVLIEAFGSEHAEIYPTLKFDNIGYFIANRFFYPGDEFTKPSKSVEILALPVAGPWLKLAEAIDYAKKIKPKICFPVHEGILINPGSTHAVPPAILESLGIKFQVLELEKETNF